MKFTILGFSHPAAYDLGLDINDLYDCLFSYFNCRLGNVKNKV